VETVTVFLLLRGTQRAVYNWGLLARAHDWGRPERACSIAYSQGWLFHFIGARGHT